MPHNDYSSLYKFMVYYLGSDPLPHVSGSATGTNSNICYERDGNYDLLRVDRETGTIYHTAKLFELNRDLALFSLLWEFVRFDQYLLTGGDLEADMQVFYIWKECGHVLESREAFRQAFIGAMINNYNNAERINWMEIQSRSLQEKTA